MIRTVLTVIAFLLAAVTGVRLYRDVGYLRAADRTVPALLAAADGGAAPAGVLIVLQPEDCLRSGELVARWNALYAARRFPVTAVVVGSGRVEPRQRELFRRQRLELPLRAITARDAGIIAEKLGHTSTPFAVMIDGAVAWRARSRPARTCPPRLWSRRSRNAGHNPASVGGTGLNAERPVPSPSPAPAPRAEARGWNGDKPRPGLAELARRGFTCSRRPGPNSVAAVCAQRLWC